MIAALGSTTADGAELGALAAAYVLITAVVGPLMAKYADRIAATGDPSGWAGGGPTRQTAQPVPIDRRRLADWAPVIGRRTAVTDRRQVASPIARGNGDPVFMVVS